MTNLKHITYRLILKDSENRAVLIDLDNLDNIPQDLLNKYSNLIQSEQESIERSEINDQEIKTKKDKKRMEKAKELEKAKEIKPENTEPPREKVFTKEEIGVPVIKKKVAVKK